MVKRTTVIYFDCNACGVQVKYNSDRHTFSINDLDGKGVCGDICPQCAKRLTDFWNSMVQGE